MKIVIANDLLKKAYFDVVGLKMDVVFLENDSALCALVNEYQEQISKEYSLADVLNIPFIKEARDAYKKFGKDPSRYRLAVESLYRRIVKGHSLYLINNLVDIGNILSLDTKRSVAVLDYESIVGDIYIRLGTKDDHYEGINRGLIDVSNIPVYVDNISPFGSTTSDTTRTMITKSTLTIVVLIICFSDQLKEQNEAKAIELFQKYAQATNISRIERIYENE